MKISRNYIALVLSLVLLLGGCKQDENQLGVKNNSKVYIKSSNGLYVSADRNQNNQLLANRHLPADWERFTIQILQDNQIALRAYNFSYVGSKPGQQGLLFTENSVLANNTTFKITEIDSGGVLLQDFQNKYVRIDTNNALIANKNNIEDADIFYIQEAQVKKSSYFTFHQLVPLLIGLMLVFISILVFQYKENKSLSIILLLLGGFCVRLFTALLSTHLNLWDEQFHALVAKNMINHPFTPMLYRNPVLPYVETSWVDGHIWLHKQPLFLWQMALSMKIFGVNVFALRLPSVMMSTIVIFFIYRIGKISINKTVAYFAALFYALSYFSLELAAGVIHTDHNDVAFMFYVCGSIWAWVEYEKGDSPRKKYFLILIGLFSGSAILVKWLTGLLVYSGWGLAILLSPERRYKWRFYRDLLISLIITVAVFLPWQIYILNVFPLLSRHEFALNTKHFFEVIEGHGGDIWWHVNMAKELYGIHVIFFLFSIIVFSASLKNSIFKIAFLAYIFIVYLFFSIAATKMIAFTYCVSFLIFIAIGNVFDKFFKVFILNPEYLPKKIYHTIYITLILGIVSGINLNIEKIQLNHTMWKKDENSYFYNRLHSTAVMKNIAKEIYPIEEFVIFNCKPDDNIPFMFFTDVIAAYGAIPDFKACRDLKNQGHKIAIFDNGNLPSYLMTDNDVIKIDAY